MTMAARILILEDDRASRELLIYLLTAAGYEVRVSDNGLHGLSMAREWNPHLVLCDLQMPGMNGYEVLSSIKAGANHRGMPVIAVTALSMAEDRAKTLAAGFDGYFSKPITPETFVGDIERFLPPAIRAAPLGLAGPGNSG